MKLPTREMVKRNVLTRIVLQGAILLHGHSAPERTSELNRGPTLLQDQENGGKAKENSRQRVLLRGSGILDLRLCRGRPGRRYWILMTGYDLAEFRDMMVQNVVPQEVFLLDLSRRRKRFRGRDCDNLNQSWEQSGASVSESPFTRAVVISHVQTFSKSIISDREMTYSLHRRLHYCSWARSRA